MFIVVLSLLLPCFLYKRIYFMDISIKYTSDIIVFVFVFVAIGIVVVVSINEY